MTGWHLAQMNVGRMVDEADSPALADFMAQLDQINALADTAQGFVWRLQGAEGNATDIKPTQDTRFIVNMSVWTDIESLFTYVYRTQHREVMVRRREWFERPENAYQVLWWVQAGHMPTVEQGLARLGLLRAEGPTPAAFTFKPVFPAPAEASVARIAPLRDAGPFKSRGALKSACAFCPHGLPSAVPARIAQGRDTGYEFTLDQSRMWSVTL